MQTQVKQHFLTDSGLTEPDLQRILSNMLGHQIDSAELYFQSICQESWSLEDGIVKEGSYHTDCGVGLRAIAGEKTGFAYAQDLVMPALQQAARAARSIAYHGGTQPIRAFTTPQTKSLYAAHNPFANFASTDKIAFLQALDVEARKQDPRVIQVMASLAGCYEQIMVVASDGTFACDIRPLVRCNVSVIIEDKGRRERGSAGGGGRYDYERLCQPEYAMTFAREAVRQALVNLDAKPAPAGMMPVVLGPGWPGVLLHEAIGHGLEGDFNRKGVSAFANRLGTRVASPGCTVVDDGTLSERRGSLTVDDEGTPTRCTVLIEDGILKGYMQDKHNAALMKTTSTGNGRRESYAHLPMPRMTNTYMQPGPYHPEEIIHSVSKGIYAPNFGGGQVDITSGKFVFSTSEAYLIEDGRITAPIKGATLIGDGPDVLTKVRMIGNDLALDPGVGVCGKEGQSVPVGVGQPTLLISELTVGGTQ